MKKILILLLSVIFTLPLVRAVDYGAIEVDVTMNPERYRTLLDRFIKADTTLTHQEVSTLYYGFPFTRSYDPRDSVPEIHRAFDAGDFDRVALLLPDALELNPLSLDLFVMGMAVYEAGHGETPGANALNLSIRSDMIATAILESGRGTIANSPFYVISRSDMDRIMRNVMGVAQIIGISKVGPVLAVKFRFPGELREHILYFDNTAEEKFRASHP